MNYKSWSYSTSFLQTIKPFDNLFFRNQKWNGRYCIFWFSTFKLRLWLKLWLWIKKIYNCYPYYIILVKVFSTISLKIYWNLLQLYLYIVQALINRLHSLIIIIPWQFILFYKIKFSFKENVTKCYVFELENWKLNGKLNSLALCSKSKLVIKWLFIVK